VIPFDIAQGPTSSVAVGWFDKVPGVSGVRPAILTSTDGAAWDPINLDAFVLDSDFLDPTGVVWTGTEFIVTTEGTSLGASGVLFSSSDGLAWSRTTLEVDVLDTAANAGGRSASTLVWTPELVQSAGTVGLASIAMAGDVIVIGGWARLGGQPMPLVWTSTDGDSWTARQLPGVNEIVRRVEVSQGQIVLYGLGAGPGGGLYDVAWMSQSLTVDWERVEYEIQDLEFVFAETLGPDGFLIRATTYTSEGPRWWHSPDASTWTPVDLEFDLVTTWHDRWVGVTCSGGGAEVAVGRDHQLTWPDTSTIDGCPTRAIKDGSEVVFVDDSGNTWRRVIERWTTDDMVSAEGGDTVAVVFVAADDVLNVRDGAGVEYPIIGALDPQATSIPLTFKSETIDGSVWLEVEIPIGTGWVNSYFVIDDTSDNEFLGDSEVDDLIDALASAFVFGAGLEDVVSSRGLLIDYFGARHRFAPDQVASLTTSTQARKWGSNAADISEVPEWTFSRAIAEPFVGIYTDDDRLVAYDQVIPGGNGNLPEFIVPFELKNAHFVAFHDPGDNPQFSGIDWYAWYVYVTYESGEPRVLAMSTDAWAP
ncbi:MAG: SH3 domain-containing protein, partial [Acidimicrobiia bacterium]|nr:SH3 domain-containing protein [Acidimicrobiia bacterium]